MLEPGAIRTANNKTSVQGYPRRRARGACHATRARDAVDNPCRLSAVCLSFPARFAVCGYSAGPAARKKTKARAHSWKEPRAFYIAGAPSASASPLCLGCTALSSPIVERASGCPRSRIGCTTAPAAGGRCASAGTATAATGIAPGAVPRCAGASRCAVPASAISSVTAGRAGTRRGSVVGALGKLTK